MGHSRFAEQGKCGLHDPERRLQIGTVGRDDRVLAPVVGPKQLIGTIEEVETHQPDPTSEERPDPWVRVSSELSALRDRIKDTYQSVASGSGPTAEEIKTAFATLAGAWDQIAESATTALDDPETRAHLKQAAGSLAAALGETVSRLGDEFGGVSAAGDTPGHQTVEESGPGGGIVDGDGESPPADEGEL
jgi:hypothetical protein